MKTSPITLDKALREIAKDLCAEDRVAFATINEAADRLMKLTHQLGEVTRTQSVWEQAVIALKAEKDDFGKRDNFADGLTNRVSEWVSRAVRHRNRYIEMMAAAYVKETNIPISAVELVETIHRNGEVVYRLRDRREREKW